MRLPERIGPYRITARLGEGGMGVVYRAEHVATGKSVALKTARVPYGSMIAGLRSEIHALTRIHHPGVVQIVEEGLDHDLPWYAMELLEGRTLDDYRVELFRREDQAWSRDLAGAPSASTMLATLFDANTAALDARAWSGVALRAREREGHTPPGEHETAAFAMGQATEEATTAPPGEHGEGAPAYVERRGHPSSLPPAAAGRLDEVLHLVGRLCAPLVFLHGAGIVHRDLKPSNIFIRDDGAPVLMDFGLVSRVQGAGGREVIDGSSAVLGTAAYMSPEQILGLVVDPRSDLYALGCILFQLLTNRVPFAGSTPVQILRRHLTEDPPRPSDLCSGVPEALDLLVLMLLAKEPRQRIGHADDLARMLAALAPSGEGGGVEIAPSAYLYRPQIAGRDEALAAMLEHLHAARDRSGRCVLVGGESGVGKTYFAAAVAREAAALGVDVVTGECVPVATPDAAASDVRGAPLHPFRNLLEAIADRCRERGIEAADRILGPRGKILAAYQPSLRHLPGQDAYPEPPEVPAQAARRRILAALGDALAAFAEERPVLLILDDLQWADELSLDFLRALNKAYFAGRSLLIVGTYRTEEVGDALREVIDAPAMARVALQRLDERTVGAIVSDMLAMAEPPAAFVRVLCERSGGNPFYVAEFLRAAVAERLLYRDWGVWRVAASGEGSAGGYEARTLPTSLRELVGRRLDGLGKDARELVEAAAALGRDVDGDLLLAVSQMPQGDVLAAVKELLDRQILDEVRPGRFRFAHDKLREIAYDRIAEPRRRALHLAGARAIEARYQGTSAFPLLYSELAYHFTEAGEIVKAIDYLELAGRQAEESFANREAARFFTEALALDERAAAAGLAPVSALRRAVWERRIGSAFLGLGKLVESQAHLHRAVALTGHAMPGPMRHLVPAFFAEVGRQLLHRAREPRWGRLSPAEREVLLEAARGYDLLVQASYYVTGELIRILYATIANLNLAERAGPSPELALAYGNAHFVAGLIPWFSLARTYGRRAHEILERVTDPAVQSWVYVLAGAYATGVGDWDEAISLGKRADAIAEEVGFRRRAEEALGVCGATYNLMGEFALGRDTSQRIYESATRGDPQTQVWGQSGVAMNCVFLGELDRAIAAAERSAELLTQKLGRPEKIFCYGVLALARLRRGDLRGALEAADAGAAAIAEGAPISFYAITAYSYVADVFLDLWERGGEGLPDRRALEKRARRSCSDVLASARIFPVHRPHAHLVRGRVAALSGDLAVARAFWEKSLAAARELRMPYDEGLAELTIALAVDRSSEERSRRLARAAALFGETGAAPDKARAERALLEG